jgi:hypothetical protein
MTSLCNYNDVMQHLSRFATEMQQEIRAETVARTTERMSLRDCLLLGLLALCPFVLKLLVTANTPDEDL